MVTFSAACRYRNRFGNFAAIDLSFSSLCHGCGGHEVTYAMLILRVNSFCVRTMIHTPRLKRRYADREFFRDCGGRRKPRFDEFTL
jgi:hypothetical protein